MVESGAVPRPSRRPDFLSGMQSVFGPYGVAVLAPLVAAAIRWVFEPLAANSAHYTLFYFAAALAAALAGWRAGLVATVLGGGLGFGLFIYRLGRFNPDIPQDYVQVGLYLLTCLLITALGAWGRAQFQRAEQIARSAHESEERFRVAQELSPDGFTILHPIRDAEGHVVDFTWVYENAAIARLNGTDPKAVVGRRLLEVLPGHEQSPFHAAYRLVAETRQPQVLEAPYQGDSIRRSTWFRVAVVPCGEAIAVLAQDTTERRLAQEALAQSAERYRSFVEASAQVVWRTNAQGAVDQPIPSWNAFTGQSEAEAAGFGWMNAIAPEDRPRVTEAWRVASAARRLYQVEYRLQRHDGQWLHILARGVPVLDADGSVREYIGTCIDVTDQRQAEATLRESEQRFRTMADAIPQLAWAAKGDGWIYWYNRRWYEYTGTTPEQMAGWGWQRVHDPQALPLVLERWRSSIASGQPFEMVFPLRAADGSFRPFLTRVTPLRDQQGRVVQWVGTNTDITDQQRTQEMLQRQARLIDLAPAATMVRTLEGTITFWSDGAVRLYGWQRSEALGCKSHELLQTRFPVALEAIATELRESGRWSGELRHVAKDGRVVLVESHWLGQSGPAGALSEILESNMDITERKQAEAELLALKDRLEVLVEDRTAELSAANKELEAFAYSVSHDLRAPLRHIDSYIAMLQRYAGPGLDEKSQKHLRIIVEASKRMGNLIDDLLALSRLGRTAMQERPVDLARLVDEVRLELAPAMVGRVIEWRVGPLPPIRGDLHLLRSAVVNLLANALKYTRLKSAALIEIGGQETETEFVCFVRDNGAGFDMRFVDKLFGVFQRLHSPQEFEGTGIGLASVRRVIQRHGGRTWAEGEIGRGATFYFSVPASRLCSGATGPDKLASTHP